MRTRLLGRTLLPALALLAVCCGNENKGWTPPPEPAAILQENTLAKVTLELSSEGTPPYQSQAAGSVIAAGYDFTYDVTFNMDIPEPVPLNENVLLGTLDITLGGDDPFLQNFHLIALRAYSPSGGLANPLVTLPLSLNDADIYPLDETGVTLQKWDAGEAQVKSIPITSYQFQIYLSTAHAMGGQYMGSIEILLEGVPIECHEDSDCVPCFSCVQTHCKQLPFEPGIVFVTSQGWKGGELGGLTGADQKCTDAWNSVEGHDTRTFKGLAQHRHLQDQRH